MILWGTILVQFLLFITVLCATMVVIVLISYAIVSGFGISVIPWLAVGFVIFAFLVATIGIWTSVLYIMWFTVIVNGVVIFVLF